MRRALRLYLIGSCGLLALAGCGRGFIQTGERENWRHEAELQCLKSGAVKDNPGVVRISPIEGPGICGADFPLKVAALGEGSALGYSDDPRPPGAIPGAPQPAWPLRPQYQQPQYQPPPPQYQSQDQNDDDDPAPPPGNRGYVPVAPRNAGIEQRPLGAPMQLGPPGQNAPQGYEPVRTAPAYPAREPVYPQYRSPPAPPQYQPPRGPQYPPLPRADDIPDDAVLPDRGRMPSPRQSYNAPYAPPPVQQSLPRLGPIRGPNGAAVKATVTPPATLSCPIVSALDRWVSEGVQPAAMRWFGQPVTEIKQISSYSCRSMVGAGTSHISEHAFGNALDIAAFVLADGRRVTVKTGWNGAPEESGFLHDVQGAACEMFTTVLAPGYNVYHYDHIHVDLMRRASGKHPCRPNAIPGEVAAARQLQKSKYAHRGDPGVTGSIGGKAGSVPDAIPGEDGYVADDGEEAVGAMDKAPATRKSASPRLDRESASQ